MDLEARIWAFGLDSVHGVFPVLKKIVCLSVCLTFFESADACDLGLMTLFLWCLQTLFSFLL